MAVDEALLNSLVHKYLASVSEKLAAKFQKEFSVETEPGETVTLQEVVETHALKRSIGEVESGENPAEDGKPKVKKLKKKAEAVKKTVFIRNISKDFDFDENKDLFEKFGKTFGFTNSGKGHGFLTFSSPDEAAKCIQECFHHFCYRQLWPWFYRLTIESL